MITIPLNGARLRVRLIEADVSRLKLDPENPRLHSAYLTHDLPARPNEKQIAAVLEQLPEFQALLDAITRNDGVFQPPLLTATSGFWKVIAVSRRSANYTLPNRRMLSGGLSPRINSARACRRNKSERCERSSTWSTPCLGTRFRS
jgi:hypothetical protein